MGKIGQIIRREYLAKVTKKSFIIMTFLGPVLIAGFYALIFYIMLNDNIGQKDKTIFVIDQSGLFVEQLSDTGKIKFAYAEDLTRIDKDSLLNSDYEGWLIIPKQLDVNSPKGIIYESRKNLSLQNQEDINSRLERVLTDHKMAHTGISRGLIDSLKTQISINPKKVDEAGNSENTSTEVASAIGMALAFAIYLFIFLYGIQVMKGVIEEKVNRIVEVIVSSVKPFQLMMGKVIGIAMVGLTQIIVWIGLSGILIVVVTLAGGASQMDPDTIQQVQESMAQPGAMANEIPELNKIETMKEVLTQMPFKFIISMFLFYFIGGYLMYASLFAAIGAAVDNETDTQQFMLPVTMPLVFAFILSISVVLRDPNGPLATWLSLIPLTSPIAMMVRLPFLDPQQQWLEILGSMGLLIISFLCTIWLAGRIYKVGILMYGKKVSYKDLYKWLRMKM
jgi:ABC-2 type transport system permease protein